MTNEMMCQIFEKGYKGWEMKGMSRADIAVELEKTVSFFLCSFFFFVVARVVSVNCG